MGTLSLQSIDAYYGDSHVLHDVNMEVGDEQLVSLIGRNGAGKSTTLKSIAGLTPKVTGSIEYDGQELIGREPYEISRTGIAFIPEHRRIFPELTVRENLRMGSIGHDSIDHSKETLETALGYFPRLEEQFEQKGRSMSGGEQQMLAIARSLMSEPELLLVDEPTEGLMPSLVDKLGDILAEVNDDGMSVLLVEQDAQLALGISDYGYVIDEGEIRMEGTADELLYDGDVQEKYLKV